jgi:hypothetical protein
MTIQDLKDLYEKELSSLFCHRDKVLDPKFYINEDIGYIEVTYTYWRWGIISWRMPMIIVVVYITKDGITIDNEIFVDHYDETDTDYENKRKRIYDKVKNQDVKTVSIDRYDNTIFFMTNNRLISLTDEEMERIIFRTKYIDNQCSHNEEDIVIKNNDFFCMSCMNTLEASININDIRESCR